ncbi:GNAT family N-acetyltransferase [Marinomonas sp. C2222]|uniref:GNAT family N-acetyltransferase n=1 Tax=Marinomonas sargassi TaxID=2984494 RepID=A0ABT2YVS1_9GAMM|nr:GNAT family N-acetyltransferase [Marinomonas sargassi]MCV2404006.1 GNAT family N-acetyltransferase [Marinomonas sargassi]
MKRFYQEHYPSGKPNKADPIWVIRHNAKILSAVRLKQLTSSQLLMAMVTAPPHRKSGLGSHLLKQIHTELKQTPCYCFALNHQVSFYIKNNFVIVDTPDLPEEIQSRYISYQQQGRKITAMKYYAE